MTAPPGQADQIITGWRDHQSKVDHQLGWSRVHRTIFTEVSDALMANDAKRDQPLPGHFIHSYADVYWDSQVMSVRRLVDGDERTHSLLALVLAVKRNRRLIPRSWWLEMFLSALNWDPDDRDQHDAATMADAYYDGHDIIPEQVFDDLAAEIQSSGQAVQDHADRHIAHRDRSYDLAASPVTFAVIHTALDDLERLAGRMHLLLTSSHMMYEHVMVPSGWQFPLMQPVFEPPEMVRRWLDETRDARGPSE